VAALIAERQLERQNIYIIGMECPGMTDGGGATLPACSECDVRRAPVFDVEITGAPPHPGRAEEPQEADAPGRFRREIDKCILCFSCRQACYGCYCETCFMDRGTLDRRSASDAAAKALYHLGRAAHLSGRCVECGACENACASGVNVRYLIKAATGFIAREYGFRAGMDTETPSALLCYETGDGEQGFWGNGDE
jgi:Fe-S oxidoreductase